MPQKLYINPFELPSQVLLSEYLTARDKAQAATNRDEARERWDYFDYIQRAVCARLDHAEPPFQPNEQVVVKEGIEGEAATFFALSRGKVGTVSRIYYGMDGWSVEVDGQEHTHNNSECFEKAPELVST